MRLEVRGEVPGLDQAGFAKAAEAAKEGCPVSQALKGNVQLRAGREAGIDPVCHTLVGAGLARSGLGEAHRLGTARCSSAPTCPTSTSSLTSGAGARISPSGAAGPTESRPWRVCRFVLTGAMLLLDRAVRRFGRASLPSSVRPRPDCSDSPHLHPHASLPRHAQHLRRALADAVRGRLVLRRHALHRRSLAVARSGRGRPVGPPAPHRARLRGPGRPARRVALGVATAYVAACCYWVWPRGTSRDGSWRRTAARSSG